MKRLLTTTMVAMLFCGVVALVFSACKRKTVEPEMPTITSFAFDNYEDGDVVRLNEGESERLRYTIEPIELDTTTVEWSSADASVAVIDARGELTAVGEGRTTITGAVGGFSLSLDVVVTPLPIKAVTFASEEIQLKKDVPTAIEFTTDPEGQNPNRITWKIDDESVAAISIEDGNVVVTGLKLGGSTTLHVIVDDEELSSIPISVPERPVNSVSLDRAMLKLKVGGSEQLVATVDPEDADDPTVTWKSTNPDLATVDQTGKVTLVSAIGGYADIIATAGGMTASCRVQEDKIDVSEVSLDKTDLRISVGASHTLIATVTPEDATYRTVTWTSSNPDIVSVDQKGRVTLLNNTGSATITATADGKTATCLVQEDKIDVSSISLDKTNLKISVGASYTLTATVTPANATYRTVTWTSSNPDIVSVDQNGRVTLLNNTGSSVITATADGKSATCKVSENRIDVTSVAISGGGVSKDIGESVQLSATVSPSNATYPAVTWTSSNESVATVDANGKVTIKKTCAAIEAGSVTITATSDGKKASTTITVKKPTLTLALSPGYYANQYVSETTNGKNFFVRTTITPMPTDFSIDAIQWSISQGATIAYCNNSSSGTDVGFTIDMTKATEEKTTVQVCAKLWGQTAYQSVTVNLVPVGLKFAAATATDRTNFGEVVEKDGGYVKALPYWNNAYSVKVYSKNGVSLSKANLTASSNNTNVAVVAATGTSNYFNINTYRPANGLTAQVANLTFTYTAGNGTTATGTLKIQATQLAVGGYCTTAGDLDNADCIIGGGASGSCDFRRVPFHSNFSSYITFARLVTVYLDENSKATWVVGKVSASFDSGSNQVINSNGDIQAPNQNSDKNYTEYLNVGSGDNKQRLRIYSHPHSAVNNQSQDGNYYSDDKLNAAVKTFIHNNFPSAE